jgi:peptidoglycan/xylan/chitin deacetylase (PgdA/CDA1 family)
MFATLLGSIASTVPPPQSQQPPWTLTEDLERRIRRAYQEGGLFILTMHPHVIGYRGRITMLDRLIGYMKSQPGVWFATLEAIATYVKPK